MSQSRWQFDTDSPFEAAASWASKWYQVPSLLVLVVFMFWTRARTWGAFIVDGRVLFSGNDAWYHYRQVVYTTKNWPSTMPYDVWTNFPQGTSVSQFGTIFDQLMATVALVVGLGNPSDNTIRMVMLFTPPAIGALTAIPTYYLGKRLGSRLTGLIAVLVLALSTGGLLGRSFVGFVDHHVAEAFTQAFAVLAIVVALQVVDAEKPVWELALDRDISGLRKPLFYGVLGGVATSLYLWTWPPGTLLLGIFGIYITLQMWITYIRDRTPEPVAFAASVIFATTFVLTLIPIDTVGFNATSFSLLQPGLALAGLVWTVLLAWIARYWDDQGLATWAYPIPSLGLFAVGFVGLAVILPDVFSLLINNIQRVLVPGSTGGAATVAEVQSIPWGDVQSVFYQDYGLAAVIAAIGALVAIAYTLFSEYQRSELLFVAIWLAIMTIAAITQRRFGYYLAVPIAVMTAYIVGLGVQYIGTISDADGGFEAYQVMAVLTVLMLLVVPMAAATDQRGDPAHVLEQSDSDHNGLGPGVVGWNDALVWMDDNTPAEGTFAGADNEMAPYATTPKTDDFQYPDGSFGVISWWDYGHWITTQSETIPVANPFQQSATDAARYLLAPNETRANEILAEMSDGENRDTRYVMVDWQMVWPTSKFTAPVVFHPDLDRSDMFENLFVPARGGGLRPLLTNRQRYYESQMVRLYFYHGSARSPGPVVTDYDTFQTEDGRQLKIPAGLQQGGQQAPEAFKRFNNTREAQQFLEQDNTSFRGGVGLQPRERVEALEHYRLVRSSRVPARSRTIANTIRQYQQLGRSLRPSDFVQNVGYTKIFERVPGATIEGSGAPANATVSIQVAMLDDAQGQPFTYRQRVQADENGEFNATVPYSTTGYDEFGPENGYTNTSVRALSDYRIRSQLLTQRNGSFQQILFNDTVEVTEGQVLGVDEQPVTANLTEFQPQGGSGSDGSDGSEGEDSGSMVEPPAVDESRLPRLQTAG